GSITVVSCTGSITVVSCTGSIAILFSSGRIDVDDSSFDDELWHGWPSEQTVVWHIPSALHTLLLTCDRVSAILYVSCELPSHRKTNAAIKTKRNEFSWIVFICPETIHLYNIFGLGVFATVDWGIDIFGLKITELPQVSYS
ncbi:MAG: hypothetical protein WBL49_13395, partial [Nitrososphaeraceae archaeon]